MAYSRPTDRSAAYSIKILSYFCLEEHQTYNHPNHLSPFVLVLYPRLRVQLYGYRRLRTRSRSSTAYGCPVYCILVQSAVPVSVPVVLWEYGLLRTSHFASHIRPYWYRYRYSQYWSNRSTRMSALALRRCCGSRLAVAYCSVCLMDWAWYSR